MIKKIFQRIGNSIQTSSDAALIDFKSLENILKYTFKKKQLLLQAMKHKSYLSISNEEEYDSNERLELLGDAVLELITTEHLYLQFKKEDEGTLSQKRSVLVSRTVLGIIAKDMELGEYLLLNKGEDKTGGRSRSSNLANLFEAIIGAIYLDGGYEPAKQFINRFVLNQRDELLAQETYFNFKSTLLELSQAKGWGLPKYKILKESGPDHDKRFLVAVEISHMGAAKGSGSNKKKAEQKAAATLLRTLEQVDIQAHKIPDSGQK